MQAGKVLTVQRRRVRAPKRTAPVGELQLRLERLRDELGLTDVEFAGYLGVTRQHWWRLRLGKLPVGRPLLRRLAQMKPDWSGVIAGELARR